MADPGSTARAGPAASSVAEDARGDFGFGARVAQQSQRRLLNRDGSFNVVREGLPWLRDRPPEPDRTDMFLRGDEGVLGVDMRRLHDVEPA